MTGCQHQHHDSIHEHITCEITHNPVYQQILITAGAVILTALGTARACFSSKINELSLPQKFTAGTALTASVAGIYWYYSANNEQDDNKKHQPDKEALGQHPQHEHDAFCNHIEENEHHNADQHLLPAGHSELNANLPPTEQGELNTNDDL